MVTVKRVLITLLFLTAATFVGLWIYSSDRTYFNEDSEIGNSSGNIFNGGLFCEKDGKIYFSNDGDDGSLYVMNSDCTNIKKVHDDKAVYINADENYIYYVRANNTKENPNISFFVYSNVGIYRINQNGSKLKSISEHPSSHLTLRGNFLYYQDYNVDEGLYLYRKQIDGTMERLLIRDTVIPTTVLDNRLIFAGVSNNHNLNAMDLSSFTVNTVVEGSVAYPIFVGEEVYYMNIEDDYKIYKMNQDGSNNTLIVDERCSTYNISNNGKYLYYQVDDTKHNRICRINLSTLQAETLLEGNYKQIHVTDRYVFFKDFDNTNTYAVSAEGSSDISLFEPPVITEE